MSFNRHCGHRVDEARMFLEDLFEPDDVIELRAIGERRREPVRLFRLDDADDALNWAVDVSDAEGAPANVYFRVCPMRTLRGDEIVRTLAAEFDDATPAEALDRIAERGLPAPSVTTWTGGGVHVYWRLTSPVGVEEYRVAAKAIRSATGADTLLLMRLPGTRNVKKGSGGPRCWVVSRTGDRHQIERFLPAAVAASTVAGHCSPGIDEVAAMAAHLAESLRGLRRVQPDS